MRKRVSLSAQGTPSTKFGTSTKRHRACYPNIHLGPQLADSELFKLCCHILSGGKLPPQGQSQEHALCFTKMKDLPRAVNPAPGYIRPTLSPTQNRQENTIVSAEIWEVLSCTQAKNKSRANSSSARANGAWQGIDHLRTSRQGYLTIRIRHKGHRIRYFFSFRGV